MFRPRAARCCYIGLEPSRFKRGAAQSFLSLWIVLSKRHALSFLWVKRRIRFRSWLTAYDHNSPVRGVLRQKLSGRFVGLFSQDYPVGADTIDGLSGHPCDIPESGASLLEGEG